MKSNKELRADSRAQLKGGWLMAVGAVFIYTLLLSAASATVVGVIIIGGPMTLGLYIFFLNRARGEKAEIENLFLGFKTFAQSLLLNILIAVFTFLWSLLLIVPGIIKSLGYSMAYFILHDNPGMTSMEAIKASSSMMKGYKGKLFCLYLSFIGWGLLSLLTFCIGFLWLYPYICQSMANFYEDIKKNPAQNPA